MAMTLRLDPERTAELRAVARAENHSMQQIVILAIDEYLGRRTRSARIAGLARRAAEDYPETLRRLGE